MIISILVVIGNEPLVLECHSEDIFCALKFMTMEIVKIFIYKEWIH